MSSTSDIDNNDSSWDDGIYGYEYKYVRTKLNACLDCKHMPYGKGGQCRLSISEQVQCKYNNHCYKEHNPDCAVYVTVEQKREFIKEEDFEI